MQLGRIYYPLQSLGPGERLGIWTRGCSKHCPGCASEDLWDTSPGSDYTADALFSLARDFFRDNKPDGITISGGEPMDQFDELMELLSLFRLITSDILVYTGYTLQELEAMLSDSQFAEMKKNIGVLIDGRYVESLNSGSIIKGSDNQNIIFFDENLRPRYEAYISSRSARELQNVFISDRVHSFGIPNRE